MSKIIAKRFEDPKFDNAKSLFEATCLASRTHAALAADALSRFGDHGALISGCVRDHFPSDVKDALRFHAREVTRLSDAAWAARPSRVRMATMRQLARMIATRDGSGFYGPRSV